MNSAWSSTFSRALEQDSWKRSILKLDMVIPFFFAACFQSLLLLSCSVSLCLHLFLSLPVFLSVCLSLPLSLCLSLSLSLSLLCCPLQAYELCVQCGQPWRAATLEGWKLYHDPNFGKSKLSSTFLIACFSLICLSVSLYLSLSPHSSGRRLAGTCWRKLDSWPVESLLLGNVERCWFPFSLLHQVVIIVFLFHLTALLHCVWEGHVCCSEWKFTAGVTLFLIKTPKMHLSTFLCSSFSLLASHGMITFGPTSKWWWMFWWNRSVLPLLSASCLCPPSLLFFILLFLSVPLHFRNSSPLFVILLALFRVTCHKSIGTVG